MEIRSVIRLWIIAALILISLLAPTHSVTAQEGQDEPPPPPMRTATGEMLGIRPIQVYADPNQSTFFQSPPQEFMTAAENSASLVNPTFVIDYVPAGQYNLFEDQIPCTTFPEEAKTAFNYAASIWSSILGPVYNVPIHIQACWLPIPDPYVLGYAGSWYYHYNFPNAPVASTYYPAALANALAGQDLDVGADGNKPEFIIAYNSNFASNFYYGTASTPPDKYNLATIVLHEIAHGLGFSGSMYVYQDGTGDWGYWDENYNSIPVAYDRFAIDSLNRQLINTSIYPVPSIALGNVLKSNAVYFNGANAMAANGGQRVKLYAPSAWSRGSSYAHLDEIYNGTSNSLMTYSVSPGETNYDPGPITRGILADVGWQISPAPPNNLTLSNTSISENVPPGTTVGTFSSSDPNGNTSFTYALVAGAGSTDNAIFSISANTLKTNAAINFEVKNNLSIRVRTTNQSGLYYEKPLLITINNVNEAASEVYLTPNIVRPGTLADVRVGSLTANDPDYGDTLTFSLAPGFGDNSKFVVVGDQLRTAEVMDLTEGTTYSIQVQVNDAEGTEPDATQTLTINVMVPYEVFLSQLSK